MAVVIEGTFKNNLFNGPYVTFYPNGVKRTECVYRLGEVVSAKGWDQDGKPVPDDHAENTASFEVLKNEAQLDSLDVTVDQSLVHSKRTQIAK